MSECAEDVDSEHFEGPFEGVELHRHNTSRNSINICGKDGRMGGWVFNTGQGNMDSFISEAAGELIYHQPSHSVYDGNEVSWGR